jgi:predicted MFS family arabinose efflux permease
MNKQEQALAKIPFTEYQVFVIAILALTTFTVILDFMVMSPMGDFLMKAMHLKPNQFALAVSGYAISAGISGILTAGFADRFDRKKLLLFFYIGFTVGTIMCGFAHTYVQLLTARIIAGLFGGVIGSISMAIVTDLFEFHHRGRVMSFIQMAFGASQILGIPFSLYIAPKAGWQMPFLIVGGLAVVMILLIFFKLKPVDKHLAIQKDRNPLQHLLHTASKKNYRIAFSATALMGIGGYMMMPFGANFLVNNLHVRQADQYLVSIVAGISTLIVMPLIGKLSDWFDKYTIFLIAAAWMMVVVVIYTNLGPTPLWEVMIFNVCMMIGIMGRMVPAGTIVTGVPEMADRGAFMSINSALQQIAGGIGAIIAGKIVVQKNNYSPLEHYNTLGYVVIGISVVSLLLLFRVDRMVKKRMLEREASGEIEKEYGVAAVQEG